MTESFPKNVSIPRYDLPRSRGLALLRFLCPQVILIEQRLMVVYLFALTTGIILCAMSVVVGCSYFEADVTILFADEVRKDYILVLGYLPQLNYGPWNVLLNPLLYVFGSMAYQNIERLTPKYIPELTVRRYLYKTWFLLIVGVSTIFFLAKNVYVEFEDYSGLGFGWVQAETFSDIANSNAKRKMLDEKHYAKFSRVNASGEKVYSKGVIINSVQPESLKVSSHYLMLLFVLLAKLWAGFFEAFVFFLALLSVLWCLNLGRVLKSKIAHRKFQDTVILNSAFVRKPVIDFLLVCILINFFCALRFLANIVKGSFGKWDQYWSLVVLTPALVLFVFGFCIFIIIHQSDEVQEGNSFFSTSIVALMSVWGSTFLFINNIILGYIDFPFHNEITELFNSIGAMGQ